MRFAFVAILASTACLGVVQSKAVEYYDENESYKDTKETLDLAASLTARGSVKTFKGTWISDTEFSERNDDASITVFDVVSKKKRTLVSASDLEELTFEKLKLSPNAKKLLVEYDMKKIFRHSTVAKYYTYDIKTKEIQYVANNATLQLCFWAPSSDRLIYILNNNIYVRQPDGKEVQLTTSGVNGIIYNGIADWVYEEEVLGSTTASWVSPDGTKLAAASFDDTEVPTFKYFTYGEDQYPTEHDLKYPKAGATNPKVELKVIDLDAIEKGWTELQAPVSVVTHDHILSKAEWIENDKILVHWQNRRQNVSSIQSCNTSGFCREVTQLKEPKGWIVANTQKILSDGNNCLMINWIGNWLQVWNLDLNTGKNIWKSRGDFTVLGVYGYDEKTKTLFYQATSAEDSTVIHVYKNDKCLSCPLKDDDGVECQDATAMFSKGLSYYALQCNGPTPGFTALYESENDTKIMDWVKNDGPRKRFKNAVRPEIRILSIPTPDKLSAVAKVHFPPGIDLNSPNSTKKYPLIIDVYGGPNNVRVKRTFDIGLAEYYATNKNVVYVLVTPRGGGNRGKDVLYSMNNHLGTVEIEDEYTIVEYLTKKYTFIDPKRTGIWGWSYGGYTTALTIARDFRNLFKAGVSVAPVTNWIYYDTIYTERFMGLPTAKDNLKNYVASDVTRNVTSFKKHDFLLIHGTADDNVHVQQTMVLSKILQHQDILFEEMIYPDQNHGISETYMHVMRTIEDFWNRHLNLL